MHHITYLAQLSMHTAQCIVVYAFLPSTLYYTLHIIYIAQYTLYIAQYTLHSIRYALYLYIVFVQSQYFDLPNAEKITFLAHLVHIAVINGLTAVFCNQSIQNHLIHIRFLGGLMLVQTVTNAQNFHDNSLCVST